MDDKLTEKIRQLLAMADHPNSNEHEAAIALEKAQALLLKHNLERADIINAESGTPEGIGTLSYKAEHGYSWKRDLVNVLAKANLCRIVGEPHNKTWHIFGTYDNTSTVIEMYQWTTLQLVWLANKEYRAYKNDEGTERGQTWKAGFYNGAILAIRDRLRKPLEAFTYGNGRELVVQNKAAVAEALHKVFPHVRKSKATRGGGYDGRAAGRSAGNSMGLTPQRKLTSNLRLGSG